VRAAGRRSSARRIGAAAAAVLVAAGLLRAARATAGAPDAYDLGACIDTALRNSPDLAAAAAEVALARARLDEAGAKRFGQLQYSQQFGAVNGATGDILDPPKQNRNAILEDLGPFIRLDLGLNVPILTFGRLSAALAAAESGLRSQEAGGEAKRAEVILSVKQLYYGLLLSRMLSAVLHDMLDHMDKAVAKTQERLDAGSTTVTEIDLLKLQAGRAKFAGGVVEVDASGALTERALRRAMALPDDAPFDIADRKLQPVAVSLAPLEQYLGEGAARRPELRQLREGLAAQTAQVEREEAGWYPVIFFAGGFRYATAPNRTDQTNPFAYDNFNYTFPYFFLGVEWDLSLLQTGARIDQARATLETLRARARSAESGMALEIRRAYGDVEKAREVIRTAEAGRKAGRGLLVLTVANFDLGIGEAEELFKGVGTYTETSADYFRAVHDYNVAVATLSQVVGEELAPLQYDGAGEVPRP
jgi:outer membrane protein TolC